MHEAAQRLVLLDKDRLKDRSVHDHDARSQRPRCSEGRSPYSLFVIVVLYNIPNALHKKKIDMHRVWIIMTFDVSGPMRVECSCQMNKDDHVHWHNLKVLAGMLQLNDHCAPHTSPYASLHSL